MRLVALVAFVSGCAAEPARDEAPAPAAAHDLWDGSTRQVLLDVDDQVQQADVLCLMGGGPHLPRAGDGRVLPGTSHIEARVAVEGVATGIQLGYVLTTQPAGDEREQEGIAWLEPVSEGERLFSIPVREDQVEPPGTQRTWQFYQRMNVNTGESMPNAPCYTGYQDGHLVLRVEAVKAT